MNKIKNITLFTFPLLFCTLLPIYLIQQRQISQSRTEYELQSKIDSVRTDQIYQYIFNYGENIMIPLHKEMIVTDSLNHSYTLGKLLKKKKFIFHFDQTNCFDCVEKYLPYIKKLSMKIGKGNIIILGSFEKSQNLFLTLQGYNLAPIPMYNINPLYLKDTRIGNLNMPYIFETDSLLQTSRFFIPEKSLPNLSELYNKSIIF